MVYGKRFFWEKIVPEAFKHSSKFNSSNMSLAKLLEARDLRLNAFYGKKSILIFRT